MPSNTQYNFWTKSLETRNNLQEERHSCKSKDKPKCANMSSDRVVKIVDTDSEDSGTVCRWNDSSRNKSQESSDRQYNEESSDNHMERRFSHLFRTDLPQPLHPRKTFTSFAEERRLKSSAKFNSDCPKLPPNCGLKVRKIRNRTSKRLSLDDMSKESKYSQSECDSWLAKTAPAELETYYPKFYDPAIEGPHCCKKFSKSLTYLNNFDPSLLIPMSSCDIHSSRSSVSWTDSSFKTSDYEGSFEDSTESLADYGERNCTESRFDQLCCGRISYDRDRQMGNVASDFGKSKSDTALDRLFSEIPENNLKYEMTLNSMLSRNSCRKPTSSERNENMLCEHKYRLKNRCSKKSSNSSRNRKCGQNNCCVKKIHKQSSQSLECIPNKNSLESNEELVTDILDRKYNTLRCYKKRSKLIESPNMVAAKGKVKDLIERFSSMETLQNKTESPLIKTLRKLDFSKTEETSRSKFIQSNKTTKSEPVFDQRVVFSVDEKESCDNCSELFCEDQCFSNECESPFTKMIKKAQISKPSRHAKDFSKSAEEKTEENICSPKNVSSISITACNSCGSKNVEQYQIYDDPFHTTEYPKFDVLDKLKSDPLSSNLFTESKTKFQPYIQLKSLRSWRDASSRNNDEQLKKFSLVDTFQNKIRSNIKSHEITTKDSPVTFDDFENFSKIEDASVLIRRLSCQSNSSESLKFDPICSSRISDLEDIPMQDSDGVNHYFPESHENKNVPVIESRDGKSSSESFPFYSKLFKSSKNYFRRSSFIRTNPEKRNDTNLNDLQRRHSLSGAPTNFFLSRVPEDSIKNLSQRPFFPLANPPASHLQEEDESSNSLGPSPPYFSTCNYFGNRRAEFGSRSMRM